MRNYITLHSKLFESLKIHIKEARARSGARVYFRKRNGKIEILAKSNKDPKDQKAVIKILRKKYE